MNGDQLRVRQERAQTRIARSRRLIEQLTASIDELRFEIESDWFELGRIDAQLRGER